MVTKSQSYLLQGHLLLLLMSFLILNPKTAVNLIVYTESFLLENYMCYFVLLTEYQGPLLQCI